MKTSGKASLRSTWVGEGWRVGTKTNRGPRQLLARAITGYKRLRTFPSMHYERNSQYNEREKCIVIPKTTTAQKLDY